MAEVPTAGLRRIDAWRACALALVIVTVVLVIPATWSGARDCPPGLESAPAKGIPESHSINIGCSDAPPTTDTTHGHPSSTVTTEAITLEVSTTTVPEPTTTIAPTTTVAPATSVVLPTAPVLPSTTVLAPLPVHRSVPVAVTTTTTEAPVLAFTDPGPAPRRTVRPKVEEKPESKRVGFIASIPRPSDVSWNLAHVGVNASLAFALVVLLGLPAELLNSALKARYGARPRRRRFRRLTALEARIEQLPDAVLLVGFGLASAIVYSQLDPSVGWNGRSAMFVAALAAAMIVVTGVVEAVRIPYLLRRHDVRSHLKMFPKAFAIAVGLVLVSRLTSFHPGFIFGITCGLAVSGRLKDEDEGRSIALACLALLVMAALAWVAWIPAADAASKALPSNLAVLFDTFLATLWVTGLQVVLFGLLPVQFLYGEKVLAWSRRGWAALYATAMFLFVQTLFHPQASEWGGFSTASMAIIAISGVVLLIAALGFWLWVKLRPLEGDGAVISLVDDVPVADATVPV
jgi:hypothetical protein